MNSENFPKPNYPNGRNKTFQKRVQHDIVDISSRGGGEGIRFAVIRGRADFQGRLFDPKYFRQGANLGFN